MTRTRDKNGKRFNYGSQRPRNPFARNPVAKHAGINKAVTHPDQSKTIPRFRKHKLHEAMFDDQ